MTIPICFAANDYYVPYMSVMMQSIMENAGKERQYKFFVLHRDITEPNRALLQQQITGFPQFTIDFIDVTQHISNYDLFVSRHITIEAYFRLLIPYILSDYKKILYFDGDMICLTDAAELFDTDLRGHLVAAVRDVGVSWYYGPNHTEEMASLYAVLLNLQAPENYFCDGMLVWDIEQFRNIISIKELFELAMSREWQVHDEDILNYLCEGKTLLLPYCWDLMANWHWDSLSYLPLNLKEDYISAVKNPKILHFKPWTDNKYMFFAEYFWKYAVHTAFYDVIVTRMKEKGIIEDNREYDILPPPPPPPPPPPLPPLRVRIAKKTIFIIKKSIKAFIPYGIVKIWNFIKSCRKAKRKDKEEQDGQVF